VYAEGIETPQNFGRAIELFKKSCDNGAVLGCDNLGVMYRDGTGVTRDLGRAAELFRKACDGGDAGECSNLGVCYREGGSGLLKTSVELRICSITSFKPHGAYGSTLN